MTIAFVEITWQPTSRHMNKLIICAFIGRTRML